MVRLWADLACTGLLSWTVSEANDMLDLFAGGGSRLALPTYFLCRCAGPPESKQRASPDAPDPPASPAGNLRRQALGAVRQNSLRAFGAPFKQLPQSDHEASALCGAAASPKNLPSQAWAQGAIPGAG